MLWGVLQMIHLWETFPKLDFCAGCGRGAAPFKETKGGISPMLGKRPLKIFAYGCEKLTWDLRGMGQLLGGALQVGSLGKWVTSG